MTEYDIFYYLMLFLAAVVGVYVLVRVGSFAYFRTRLEHFRATMRETKGEDVDNG